MIINESCENLNYQVNWIPNMIINYNFNYHANLRLNIIINKNYYEKFKHQVIVKLNMIIIMKI